MDDAGNAIEVKHVSKFFKIRGQSRSLKDYVVYHGKTGNTEINQVLNDVSFSVKKGEVLGIIGRNGSGKSTMLKMLTRILHPSEGTIETDGRISCLIELGAGFHPDMTGRENVFINSSIFGLSDSEVKKRFQDIEDFAEIGNHIDERVRNYSSGMYLRLAFSIAINVDANIMLIDEILAVGDVQFQEKCLNKIRELKERGVSIVLVTHSTEQAAMICDRVIWIDEGVIREEGDPQTVGKHYVDYMLNRDVA